MLNVPTDKLTARPELLAALTRRQRETLKSMGFTLDGEVLRQGNTDIRLFVAGEYQHFACDDGKLCIPFLSGDELINHLRRQQFVSGEAVIRQPHTVEEFVAAVAAVEGSGAVTILSADTVRYRVRRNTENVVVCSLVSEIRRSREKPCPAK